MTREVRPVSRAGGIARTVGLDVVAPLVVFQGARLVGVPVVWALVLSGLPPLVGVGWDWARRRTLEVVGAVNVGGFVLSVVLAVISGDPRVVLLEGVALTAAFGIGCLVSVGARRPLIFHFAQVFYGGRHATAVMAAFSATASGDSADVGAAVSSGPFVSRGIVFMASPVEAASLTFGRAAYRALIGTLGWLIGLR